MARTLADVAQALGVEVLGDGGLSIRGLSEPGAAGPDDLALAMSPKHAAALQAGAAQAAVVWAGCDWQGLGLKGALVVARPRRAMADLTRTFDQPDTAGGIHPSAVVDDTAQLGADVSLGPFCVIGAGAKIGDGSRLGAHVTVAGGSVIGSGAQLAAGVRIERQVRIGARAILHPNVVIGADGFSFVTDGPSHEERAVQTAGRTPLQPPDDATRRRIHSLGGVEIGDDVEIGANSCVDAGTIRPTRVGAGCKIDNLVQVGHNVVLGQDCVLCAQAAVAGSAVLGDRVVMGGKSGIRDNIAIGSDVVLAGGAIVLDPVPEGSFVIGYPARPVPEFRAAQRALRRLTVSKPVKKD